MDSKRKFPVPANRTESKFSSAIYFTTKFQKCSSIFVLRNGIPKVFCSTKQPEFHRNKPFVSSSPPAFRRIILLSEILNLSFAFFSFPFYDFFLKLMRQGSFWHNFEIFTISGNENNFLSVKFFPGPSIL
jgi:hypothetical protein